MSRLSAFSFELLDIHLQSLMVRGFAVADQSPRPFEISLKDKLQALKRLFDEEAHQGGEAAAAA